jgi:MFS family permease
LTISISNFIIAGSIAGIILSGSSPYGLWASLVVFGAFYGATFPMYGACGGDYFNKEIMGRVIGAWTPFYGLGAIVGHRRLL